MPITYVFFPGWMFLRFIHACLEYWKRLMPTDRRGAQSEREVVMSPQLQIEKNCERMERRKVEQWSDKEVEVGVLIRKKQTPLSPRPPDTHTHTEKHTTDCPHKHTWTHNYTPKGTNTSKQALPCQQTTLFT